METQPDALSEDQVWVITYRTRGGGGRSGFLYHESPNCNFLLYKEVRIEVNVFLLRKQVPSIK